MTRHLAALALVATLVSATAATAQTSPVVIELYTSQGCSSCPPADALLRELAMREDVIALALHVDYWDYIGWKDTFAQPMFTKRQKGYARAAGHRTIYTPQMVIDGEDHVIGVRPMELAELIQTHRDRPAGARIRLVRAAGSLQVDLDPGAEPDGPFTVELIRFVPASSVAIERGENAGRTIDYSNIVTTLTPIGDWDGTAPLSLSTPVEGEEAVAVIVQRLNYGPIVASAALR